MPQIRDLLERFRPAGAPGAAARAGVPADRSHELADELAPVLTLLDRTDAECGRIIAGAHHQAQRITTAARVQATAIAEDADKRAGAARDEAVRHALVAARADTARTVAEAERQAVATGELAARRVPVLADYAVSLIRQLRDTP